MRLRVTTCPPLPLKKAWISCLPLETIADLRLRVAQLFELRTAHIALELLDYPLLESTSAAEVLQSDDIVQIKSRTHPSDVSAATTNAGPSSADTSSDSDEKAGDEAAPPIRSSKPTNGLESSSLVPAKRTMSSSSPSSASTSSASSDEESPPPLPPKSAQAASAAPGRGKAATRARNARKRKKRDAERAALPRPTGMRNGGVATDGPERSSDVSANPSPDFVSRAVSDPVMTMFSQSNKNKRKGYKRDLQPQYVAPAQHDAMPPNLIISRVDVQADDWVPGRRIYEAGDRDIIPVPTPTDGVPASAWDTLEGATAKFASAPLLTDPSLLQRGEAVVLQVLELSSVTLSPAPRLYWGTVAAMTSETIDAPHLLPTDASESVSNPTESRWSLRLALHPACRDQSTVEDEAEDGELPYRLSHRQARKREVIVSALQESLDTGDERLFHWEEILAAKRCT